MSRFEILSTPLSDLVVVQREAFEDQRGFLSRLFCSEELLAHGWSGEVKQINHTLTRDVGVVRGMQRPRSMFAGAVGHPQAPALHPHVYGCNAQH